MVITQNHCQYSRDIEFDFCTDTFQGVIMQLIIKVNPT